MNCNEHENHEVPEGLYYTKEHEWVKVEGDTATIGITDPAQCNLGEILECGFVLEVGDNVKRSEEIGYVEPEKIPSDVYAPVSGEIIERNERLNTKSLEENKENLVSINEDPYGEGWLIRIKLSDVTELDDLMDSVAYKNFVQTEGKQLL